MVSTLRTRKQTTWGLSRFSRSENGTVPFDTPEVIPVRVLRRKHDTLTTAVRATGTLFVLFALVGGAGCAQYQTYRATELPLALQAPETKNIQEINLSRLGNFSVNSQRISPGDVLEVTILTDLTKQVVPASQVRVGKNGVASVQFVGDVALAGLDLEGAEQTIAAAGVARRVFQKPPHVTVTMEERCSNMIWVIGAVEEPGRYELPRSASSLLAALVEAGGLSEDADQKVEIRRPGRRESMPYPIQQPPGHLAGDPRVQLTAYHEAQAATAGPRIIRVNLANAAAEGNAGHYLEDGDVVMVAKRAPKPIYVMGLVREPGEIELPPSKDMYLLDALAKAGDRTMQVADRVIIRRQVPDQEVPVVIETSIREAKRNRLANVRLAPGDVISVEETPATVVLDALKSFIRFGVTSSIPLF